MSIRHFVMTTGVVAATVFAAGCSGGNEELTGERPAVPVRVEVLQPLDQNVVKTYTGSLEGQNQAVLYAKIAEAVEAVRVREGDAVKTGQVLVQLDKDGPTSNYQQALSVYQNAEKNYRKMKYLYEEGAVSESQFDAAETDFEVARASFESARRLVEIQSPIDGTVTSVAVRRGDYLTQGSHVATVAATDRLRVKFDVKTADIALLNEGDSVLVVSEDVDRTALGVVSAVAQSADPFTRSFQVEALVDNFERHFRPGMFVKVQLVVQRLVDVLTVMRDAVVSLSDGDAVYIVDNGMAFRRTVTLGADLQGRVVVESGLDPGDSVVTLGQSYLDDSTKVRITDVKKGAR